MNTPYLPRVRSSSQQCASPPSPLCLAGNLPEHSCGIHVPDSHLLAANQFYCCHRRMHFKRVCRTSPYTLQATTRYQGCQRTAVYRWCIVPQRTNLTRKGNPIQPSRSRGSEPEPFEHCDSTVIGWFACEVYQQHRNGEQRTPPAQHYRATHQPLRTVPPKLVPRTDCIQRFERVRAKRNSTCPTLLHPNEVNTTYHASQHNRRTTLPRWICAHTQ